MSDPGQLVIYFKAGVANSNTLRSLGLSTNGERGWAQGRNRSNSSGSRDNDNYNNKTAATLTIAALTLLEHFALCQTILILFRPHRENKKALQILHFTNEEAEPWKAK